MTTKDARCSKGKGNKLFPVVKIWSPTMTTDKSRPIDQSMPGQAKSCQTKLGHTVASHSQTKKNISHCESHNYRTRVQKEVDPSGV